MRTPRSSPLRTAAFLVTLAVSTTAGAQANVIPQAKVLDFDTMAGVTAPFTGAANPIRGVNGGGLPWELDRARGVLRANGDLDIDVRGLVLARRDPVPLDRQGTNPAATFRAIVSCLTIEALVDELGGVTLVPQTVNRITDQFPASTAGDARIRATVDLPHPCFAPIVFVTNANGAWFSVTGVESVRVPGPPGPR